MLSGFLRHVWNATKRLHFIALAATGLLAFACLVVLLSLRYWILPDIERYHDIISKSVSQSLGQPVTIGKIEADWRGMRPHLLLSDVRIFERNRPGLAALVLQHVDTVVSWKTLLRAQLRLYSLEFDQPDISVRRDAQGVMYIAGMALSAHAQENNLANWLLHQPRIVVRDARISWLDEQRAAPELALERVNLLVDNSGSHHRFALRALPPAALAAQLDVRGDFSGKNFDDLNAWRGQLYTELGYVDVAAWRSWLDLPDEFMSGKGALRGWLGIEAGKISQMTADLALANVQAQLGKDLSRLDMRSLHGRVVWLNVPHGFELSTHKLSLQMSNGLLLQPTDFDLHLADASGKQPATGEMRANTLELANLVSLTDALPLEHNLKKQLAEFSPQGTVSSLQAKWQGDADKLVHYQVKAHFDRLSMKRVGKLPGFSGLSGEVDGNENSGTLTLNAHKLNVDAPQIMPEPLAFDTFTGKTSWRVGKNGLEVEFGNVSAANADLAGTAFGSYQSLPVSPGMLDLTVNLTRAMVRHTSRYIPLIALDKQAIDWVRDGLLDGQGNEFSLRLHGDLKDFPFPENKKGIFRINARAKGVALEYVKGWPRIDNGAAELLIQGKRLEVTATSATTVGGNLQKISVVMPDMLSPELVLQVRGEAVGETSHGLDFIQQSPVRSYIDGFTDGMTAHGNGKLDLQVDIPLRGAKPVTVSGSYNFVDNEVNLGASVPMLRKTNGELLFTQSGMRTRNASAQILGGPATLELESDPDGTVHARAHGSVNMESLRRDVTHPLLAYLHGGSDWEADINVQKKLADVIISSNLVGLVSDLPVPFSKSADTVIPLRFEMKNMNAKQDVVSLQYGKLLGAKLLRREENGEFVIKRGTVNFGNTGKWLDKDGIWLAGTVPQLSLAGWGSLLGTLEAGKGVAGGSIAGADLRIQNLDAYGYIANDLHISARNRDGLLSAQLTGKEVNGVLSWQTQGGGTLVARLKNLSLNEDESKKELSSRKPAAAQQPDNSTADTVFPALDLAVDDLVYNGKMLGRLEVQAQQQGRDWLLERIRLVNPGGVLTADGKWNTAAPQTQLNAKLEISDAGKVLARTGYPNTVKNGSGTVEGVFSWSGGPKEFSYAALDGTLKLDAGKGQFLKMEPGIGKLLGILSLQALPRHITLDFADVFSDGFAFDSITGSAQIKHGVLRTNYFRIDGSSAKATMQGQIDLDHETQNLRVRVLPTVGNTVSLLGAFAAGPVVGMGAFIVNKLLREPLDKLASFEYNVTGTWADPNVEKAGSSKSVARDKK